MIPTILPNDLAPYYNRPEFDWPALRRQHFLSDFELAGVPLDDRQSLAVDQILSLAPLDGSSPLGHLVQLAPADRAIVSSQMAVLPQSNPVINFQKGHLQ